MSRARTVANLGNGVGAADLDAGAAASNLGNYVTTVNGSTGAVTVSATPTTAQVLSATAGATAGAVGTYALCSLNFNGGGAQATYAAGATMAGAYLTYTSPTQSSGNVGSGTWRLMGYTANYPWTEAVGPTVSLWLRIS